MGQNFEEDAGRTYATHPQVALSHSVMVLKLAKRGEAIVAEMTADKADVWHLTTGIETEASELLDAAKKYCCHNKPLDLQNVIEELGDLEFYMERLRQILGISRQQTLEANIWKLHKRYPGLEYSNEAAQIRADKMETGETLGSSVTGD